MKRSSSSKALAAMVVIVAIAGCSAAVQQLPAGATQSGAGRQLTPAEQARADDGRPPYTAADVAFMQGMIHHHAQAVVMAGWAASHGARSDVRILASRIDVSQRDEIAMMQRWLRDRRESAPDPFGHHDMPGHDMPGMSTAGMTMSDTLMPGMLAPEQMKQLDASKGAEFDRLFLTFMIQHHAGALTMVDTLFSNPGAGQDGKVFRFASDVDADQTTEIERMRSMLESTAAARQP